MKLKVNHVEKICLAEALNVADLLKDLDVSSWQGLAVALNQKVVPRSEWNSQNLSENDDVLIIRPVQGG